MRNPLPRKKRGRETPFCAKLDQPGWVKTQPLAWVSFQALPAGRAVSPPEDLEFGEQDRSDGPDPKEAGW